jgi:amino acid transporter
VSASHDDGLSSSVVTLTAVVLAHQITLPQIWSGFQLVGDGTGDTDFAVSAVVWGAVLILFTTVVNAIGVQLIVLQALGGGAGTVFLVCIVIAVTVCALAVHTAGIRLMFAMARDNALPAAGRLARIDPKRRTPVVPAVLIGVVAVLILVVNISSPKIFTAVTGVAIIMIYIAYLLVTAPMLVRRFRGQWPGPTPQEGGYFSLGRWGLPVSVVAVLWGALMALNLAWPREDVYGEGLLAWTAFLFIGAVVVIGLARYRLRGRHHVGTLPEHLAEQLEGAP